MSVDTSTMTIIAAVGGAGATCVTALMQYVKATHRATIADMNRQNKRLEERANHCEEDRKELHKQLDKQSDRITDLSRELGRLERKVDKNHDDHE